MRCGLFKLVLPSLGVLATVGSVAKCDSTALIFLRLVQLDRVQVIGTTPVKLVTLADGTTKWAPVCDGSAGKGGAEELRFNFNLQSTVEGDNDLQIRPGQDAVGKSIVRIGSGRNSITEGNFSLKLECLQAHDGNVTGPACTGRPNPAGTLVPSGLGYNDHMQGNPRHTPVGVAILIDQSGSILGTVDKDTCLEGKDGAYDQIDLIEKCQSDHAGLRLSAAKNILGTLNGEDPAIVFQFSEEFGCRPVCDLTSYGHATPTPDQILLGNCYSTDRNIVVPQKPNGPIDLLQGTAKGRSNLWACVDFVHQYLQTKKGELVRHLVVLTDGPDTCSPDSEDFQHCFTKDDDTTIGSQPQEACGGARSFDEAAKTWTDYQDQGHDDIHLSFIQFQSKGYPQMDARMQQAACETGGHFIFLNFNSMQKPEFGGERRDALFDATTRIRNSFSGYWTLVSDVPAFTGDPSKDAANVARGLSYSIAGTLQMTAPAIKTTIPAAHFAWGGVTSLTPPQLPNTDSRVAAHKACATDADCPGTGTACGLRCNLSTFTCRSPGDGKACPGGICCEGACDAGRAICQDTTKGSNGNPGPCP